LQKGLAFLYPENRDKKSRQVMVNPFEPGLRKTTGRANPRLFIQMNGLRLYSANEKEHGTNEIQD